LEKRAAFKRGNCEWWQWTFPLHLEHITKDKIYAPYMATSNRFALDTDTAFIGLTDTTVLFDNGQPEDLRYLLGLLNSRLLSFRFRYIGKLKSAGLFEYFHNSVAKLPIRRIAADDERHTQMVEFVQKVIDTKTGLRSADSDRERKKLTSQLRVLESLIDRLTYELYGMDESDISLIDEVLDRL
jgi:hypothetical protein